MLLMVLILWASQLCSQENVKIESIFRDWKLASNIFNDSLLVFHVNDKNFSSNKKGGVPFSFSDGTDEVLKKKEHRLQNFCGFSSPNLGKEIWSMDSVNHKIVHTFFDENGYWLYSWIYDIVELDEEMLILKLKGEIFNESYTF